MTLEEKIGQMTQLEIGMITKGDGDNIRIDLEKLEKAVVKYGAGSILNVKDQALTVDKWHEIIGAIQTSEPTYTTKDSSDLRNRFNPWRQLHSRFHVVSSGDRNGGDVESCPDATRC